MNQSSDAAEQIVRMSLQGFEVGARITGSGGCSFTFSRYER